MACVSDRSQHSSVSDEQPQTAVQQSMHKSDSLTSQHRAQKLRFVSSVEFRHSSGKPNVVAFSRSNLYFFFKFFLLLLNVLIC